MSTYREITWKIRFVGLSLGVSWEKNLIKSNSLDLMLHEVSFPSAKLKKYVEEENSITEEFLRVIQVKGRQTVSPFRVHLVSKQGRPQDATSGAARLTQCYHQVLLA